ncbi:MAG: TetR/AcrR family transcriptional regulator [Bacteroidales bacterium]|nr:TetR/AcrR family transcriptional regulator [Bacteroidales bacterium]
MKNKEIQEKRMKGYFIQAAKDILRGEGIQGISVRNVADQAGYSYATLYNYFEDINDLIFLCVADFQEECILFIENRTKNERNGLDKLMATVLAYVRYFTEYPGIFDLFFLTRVGDFGNKQTTIELIGNSLDKACEKDWKFCITHKLVSNKRSAKIKLQLKYIVVGLLLFYINRRIPDSYSDFIHEAESQIKELLIFSDKRK